MSETSNSHSQWLPKVASFLIPALAPLVDIDFFSANPLWLIAILPAWGVTYVMTQVLSVLWQRYQASIVDWCDLSLRTWFRKTEKTYLERITYRCRDFDVKGLSTQGPHTLELQRVYVDLHIVAKPMHNASANPIGSDSGDSPSSIIESTGLWDVFKGSDRIAILGAPGSGKTTLLKYGALTLAGPRSSRIMMRAPKRIPIFLTYREVADKIAKSDSTIAEVSAQCAHKAAPIDVDWLRKMLLERRCVIMLDGLDEVGDLSTRRRVAEWTEEQISTFPGNLWALTSRPFGYQEAPLSGFTILSVEPLRRHQISRFLHQWYLATEIKASQVDDEGVRLKADEGARNLLSRIDRSSDIAKLSVNPLLLTLIANVHRFRSSLPGRRVELYNEIFEVFLGRRQEARGVQMDLTPAQRKLVLQSLAWHLMQARKREIMSQEAAEWIRPQLEKVCPSSDPVEFLKSVERGSGLLLEIEAGNWSFAHKTFQEYLAAVYVHERNLASTLPGFVDDEWWHETIRLYVAQGDASMVVNACLLSDPPSLPSVVLAVRCAEEARELSLDVRQRLQVIVERELESTDVRRRQFAAECRMELRVRSMPQVDESLYLDDQPITNAEYQLFVDSTSQAGTCRLPDQWMEQDFPKGQASFSVVGVRGIDALCFCEWLTTRSFGDWAFRLPTVAEAHKFSTRDIDPYPFWCRGANGRLEIFWPDRGIHGETATAEVLGAMRRQMHDDLERFREMPSGIPERWTNNRHLEDFLGHIDSWCTTGRIAKKSSIMERLKEGVIVASALGLLVIVLLVGLALSPLVLAGWLVVALGRRVRGWLSTAPAPSAQDVPSSERETAQSQPVDADRELLVGPLQVADRFVSSVTSYLSQECRYGQVPIHGRWLSVIAGSQNYPEVVRKAVEDMTGRAWRCEGDREHVVACRRISRQARMVLLCWAAEILVSDILDLVNRLPAKGISSGRRHRDVRRQAAIAAWVEIWAIERRVTGQDPPFERVRVMKERRRVV